MIKDRFSGYLKDLISEDPWLICQEAYRPEENLKYESLFGLTNGYLGTRGSYEEGGANSIPCTYINGVFDKSETFMRELANMPNWLLIRLYTDKQPIAPDSCEILDFIRVLDMKKAALFKRYLLRDKNGRETLIEGVRFVSRAHVHRMAVRIYVTPVNYEGIIEAENILDGSVINFCDAPRFKVKHTYITEAAGLEEDGGYLEVATRDRQLHVGTGGRMTVCRNEEEIGANRSFGVFAEQATEFKDFTLRMGETAEITKYVGIWTEREAPAAKLRRRAAGEVEAFIKTGFAEEFTAHTERYREMWASADIRIEGDAELNRAIRFNIFHLMSTGNERDDRVNIGAKLLHGEEYGGHAFWDTELFMLPFFAWLFPETAGKLETYRYRMLGAARENARKNGYCGAQYPWESADDGTEQCPAYTIEPDGTCYRCYVADYEHHVTAAVAYGVRSYVKITGDREFLCQKGLEILIETARFWVSRCEYNQACDRYEIRQVTGPDEWHEPVDNNLYTNYLAGWNISYVTGLLKELEKEQSAAYAELTGRLAVTPGEMAKWQEVQAKIYLPGEKDGKLLEQFEGYFDLEEVLIEQYDQNDWPVKPARLNLVDRAETQIIKQADVVMLLHLLGEEFDEETQKINYAYYEKRTLHGSSLSPSVYAVMGLKTGNPAKAYRYLKRAAMLDLLDLQKNTREGIHAANAGGVWQTVIFGFAGVSVDEAGVLCLDPRMPAEWERISFRLHYRGSFLEFTIDGQNRAEVKLLAGESIPVKISKNLFQCRSE